MLKTKRTIAIFELGSSNKVFRAEKYDDNSLNISVVCKDNTKFQIISIDEKQARIISKGLADTIKFSYNSKIRKENRW